MFQPRKLAEGRTGPHGRVCYAYLLGICKAGTCPLEYDHRELVKGGPEEQYYLQFQETHPIKAEKYRLELEALTAVSTDAEGEAKNSSAAIAKAKAGVRAPVAKAAP